MTREEISFQFSGRTHEHHLIGTTSNLDKTANNLNIDNNIKTKQQPLDNSFDSLSTITILHRHPMYDSLVLIKKYKTCLKGYSLEFPTSDVNSKHQSSNNYENESNCMDKNCCKSKLVSLYLDGDDPIYQSSLENRNVQKEKKNGLLSPEGEIVHVPINGLLERLNNYDRHGISIDSRVYAFAMGLKTAEKFLSTSSIKELQETPPI